MAYQQTLVPKWNEVKRWGEIVKTKSRQIIGSIRFGDIATRDYYDEFFTPKTDLGIRNGSERPLIIEHFLEPETKGKTIGYAVYEKKDDGWEYEAEILDTDTGNAWFDSLSNDEWYSSGASSYRYTERKWIYDGTTEAFELIRWFLIEQSVVKRPADFFNPQILIKSVEGNADLQKHLLAILMPLVLKDGKLSEMMTLAKSVDERLKVLESEAKSNPVLLPITNTDDALALINASRLIKAETFD